MWASVVKLVLVQVVKVCLPSHTVADLSEQVPTSLLKATLILPSDGILPGVATAVLSLFNAIMLFVGTCSCSISSSSADTSSNLMLLLL